MLSKLPQRFLAVLMAMLMLSVDLFAVAPDFNLRRGTAFSVRLVDEINSKGKGTVWRKKVEEGSGWLSV